MDQKLELLSRVPLFSRLNEAGLREVAQLTDEVDVEAGRELTTEGAFAHEFFLILDGSVSIERNGAHLATMGPGDFFGEIALIDRGPRSATATSDGPCRLLVLGHRGFNSLMDQFPDVRTAVLEALAHRVRRLEPDATS